jgi:EmrB/QacA subfamily drug resistance transporter
MTTAADNTAAKNTSADGAATPGTRPGQPSPLRWKALGVLLLVEFILILDISVVNIALPTIQTDLGFKSSSLAWVIDGYVLTAGGLLLLGGRLGDLFGRRRVFMIGLVVFGVASLTSGLAQDPAMLIASRVVQGAGEALTAPAAFGLIALLFQDKAERAKAVGFFGGVGGIAGTGGALLSGVIVEYTTWRLIFLINIPVVLFALAAVTRLVQESRADKAAAAQSAGRPDYLGGVLSTGGLTAVVYGLIQASTHSWGSSTVWGPIAGGLVLLVAFVVNEATYSRPLVPLAFFRDRTRATANLTGIFFQGVFLTQFVLVTLYLQDVRHFSAVRAGLSFVPLGVSIGVAIGAATGLRPKIGTKPLLIAGFLICGAGTLLYSRITVGGSFWSEMLPGLIAVGFGSGLCLPTLTTSAVHEVTEEDAGLASGTQQALQQVGGAIGLAVLFTIAIRHATHAAAAHTSYPSAITSGYSLAFKVGAAALAVGAVLVLALLKNDRTSVEDVT